MELINYINNLSIILHFDEKYFWQLDKENNKHNLICLTSSTKNNLGNILSNNENIYKQFISILLNYYKTKDENIVDIKLFINFEQSELTNKYIGISILFIRDELSINLFDDIPEEIINNILSFTTEKDVINFGITYKKYYNISNNNLLWFNRILIDFDLQLKYDINYDYKKLVLCKFKYGDPETFSKNVFKNISNKTRDLNPYLKEYIKFLLNNKLFIINNVSGVRVGNLHVIKFENKFYKDNLSILCDSNEVELLKILINNYKLKKSEISILLNHQIMRDDKNLRSLLLTSQNLTKEQAKVFEDDIM